MNFRVNYIDYFRPKIGIGKRFLHLFLAEIPRRKYIAMKRKVIS